MRAHFSIFFPFLFSTIYDIFKGVVSFLPYFLKTLSRLWISRSQSMNKFWRYLVLIFWRTLMKEIVLNDERPVLISGDKAENFTHWNNEGTKIILWLLVVVWNCLDSDAVVIYAASFLNFEFERSALQERRGNSFWMLCLSFVLSSWMVAVETAPIWQVVAFRFWRGGCFQSETTIRLI